MTEQEFVKASEKLANQLVAGAKNHKKEMYYFCGEHVKFDVWYNARTRNAHFLLEGKLESIFVWFPDVKDFRTTVLQLYKKHNYEAANNYLHRKKR